MPSIEVVMVPSSPFNTPVLEMLKHVHTQPTSNRTKATKVKRDALAAGHLIKAHMAHNRILGVLLLLVLVRLLVWYSGCWEGCREGREGKESGLVSVGELSTLFIAVDCFVASIFDMKRRNGFFLFLSFLSIRSHFLHLNTFIALLYCFTHFEVRILSCIHFRFHFLSLLASIVACLLLHDQL